MQNVQISSHKITQISGTILSDDYRGKLIHVCSKKPFHCSIISGQQHCQPRLVCVPWTMAAASTVRSALRSSSHYVIHTT